MNNNVQNNLQLSLNPNGINPTATQPNYLINEAESDNSVSARSQVTLSAQSQTTGTQMLDPYYSMLDQTTCSEFEALAQGGYYDHLRQRIAEYIGELDYTAQNSDNQDTAALAASQANSLRNYPYMSDAEINNAMFGGSASNQALSFPIYQPYTPSASDSIGAIIEGNRQNIINSLLDTGSYIQPYVAQQLNEYYADWFTPEQTTAIQNMAQNGDIAGLQDMMFSIYDSLMAQANNQDNQDQAELDRSRANQYLGIINSGDNIIGELCHPEATGHLLFNENAWRSNVRQLQKWNNLMLILAKLQQAINESQDIVQQEMTQNRGYQGMNLTQLASKEISAFNKFANTQVREIVDGLNQYNENYNQRLRARAEELLNDAKTEFVMQFIGAVASIFGLVFSVATGSPVMAAITTTSINTAITKLTTEDDVAYQKRMAEIDQRLANAKEAQRNESQKTKKELEEKRIAWQKAIDAGMQESMLMVEALSLGIGLAVDSLNSADFVGITENGYHRVSSAKILNLQNQIQSLMYLVDHIKKIKKEQRNSRSRIHQEMTGIKGHKTAEAEVSVQADDMLQVFQRKVGYLQEAVSSFNQARQSYENALAAEKNLNGRIANGIVSGMFGALSPITGNYYLGAGTGALNGYLNYRNTKKVTKEKKNYDPDRMVSMQGGGAIQVSDFEVEGAIAGIEVNDNSPLGNEIRNLVSNDINSLNYATTKTSKNRMRFDYTTAAVVARKIDTLRRIEQALVTLRHEKNSARGVVHSQMSEGAESYESSDTAQKIVSQKYDLYTQAYQMKSSSIQERIQAHNQRVTDQMNIDRARFGIYTSAASGALAGIAGGMYAGTRQSDFMARAFMRTGDTVISGMADELYEVNMPDSDYNLTDNKFSRPTYQQFVEQEQLNSNLDQVLATMDREFYDDLVIRNGQGAAVVDNKKIMEKIKAINTDLMFEKAMAAIKKSIADARNVVQAEMSGQSGHQYTQLGNQTLSNEKALAVSSVRTFAQQLQDLTGLQTQKSQAQVQYQRSTTRTGLVAGVSALGAMSNTQVMEGGFQTASGIAGAATDLSFASQDMHERTLTQELNKQDQIADDLKRNQDASEQLQLSRLDKLEAELTLKSLYLRQTTGEFGLTAVNNASIELIRRLLEKIDKIRDAYYKIRSEKLSARNQIHSVVGSGAGQALSDIAAEIGKLVNQYVNELVEQQELVEQEKSKVDSNRASQVSQSSASAYGSVSQAVIGTSNAINSNGLSPIQSRQLWDGMSQLQGAYGVVGRYQTKGQLESEVAQTNESKLTLSESDFSNLNNRDMLAISAKEYQSKNSITGQSLQMQNNINQYIGQSLTALSVYLGARAHERIMVSRLHEKMYEKELEMMRQKIKAQKLKMDQHAQEMKVTLQGMIKTPENQEYADELTKLINSLENDNHAAVHGFFTVAKTKDNVLQIKVDPAGFATLESQYKKWDGERNQLLELNRQYLGYQEDRHAFRNDMAKIQAVLTDYQSQSTKIYNLIKSFQEIPVEQLPLISANPPIKDTQQWLAHYFALKPTEKKAMLDNATASEKQLIQNVDALHDEYVEQFKDNQMLLMFDEKYGGDVVDEIIDEYENTAAGTNLGSENYAAIWRQARNYNNAKIFYARRVAQAKSMGVTTAPNGAVPKSEVLKALEKVPNHEAYLAMLVQNSAQKDVIFKPKTTDLITGSNDFEPTDVKTESFKKELSQQASLTINKKPIKDFISDNQKTGTSEVDTLNKILDSDLYKSGLSDLKFDFEKQQQLESLALQGTVPQTEISEILKTVPQNQTYIDQFFEDGKLTNLEFKQDADKLIEASNLEKSIKDQLLALSNYSKQTKPSKEDIRIANKMILIQALPTTLGTTVSGFNLPREVQNSLFALSTQSQNLEHANKSIEQSRPEWISQYHWSKYEADNRALTMWMDAVMAPELSRHLYMKGSPYQSPSQDKSGRSRRIMPTTTGWSRVGAKIAGSI